MARGQVVEGELSDRRFRAEYDDLFEACPDAFIQQSTYWAEAIRDLGPDRPIFLLYRDGDEAIAGLPLYLYEHPRGNVLTSVPQAGPLGGIFFREGLSGAESFAWLKQVGELRRARFVGRWKIQLYAYAAATYNLLRLARLAAA